MIIFGVLIVDFGAPSIFIHSSLVLSRLSHRKSTHWPRRELGQAKLMDDLLAEVGGGDSGIGLNIVCDAPPAASGTTGLASGGGAAGGNNKRRKKNKYERRRAKARQAREEKERQKLMAFVPATDQPTSRPSSGAAVAVDGDKVAPSERRAVDEQNESSDAGADADEDNNEDKAERDTPHSGPADDASETSASEASESESESEDDDDSPAPSPAPPSSSGAPQKISRRVHDATLLDDERKRADYMATFHARPHEIDRRSNASGRIKESRESNHIFEADDDEEEDDGTNSSDNNNSDGDVGDNDEAMELEDKQDEQISAPKCPFEAIGLHPRLANAVSSERGFGYDRPTIIQTNAARALISTNQSGGKKAKKQKTSGDKLPNLFVQSETGSGKTLAYLLPIVQVRFFFGKPAALPAHKSASI